MMNENNVNKKESNEQEYDEETKRKLFMSRMTDEAQGMKIITDEKEVRKILINFMNKVRK